MSKRLPLALVLIATQCVHAQVLEEVIVTAQKRSENVLEVPIAITAFTGQTLEALGARNLNDVGRFTAGVDMNNNKSLQPTYTIRGVETLDWTIGSDPAVAVYVDGVYSARGAGAEAALVDVERIEVLKGPQGTLFGRNATGGAIHIITPRPSFETEGRIKLTGGNYDRRDGELVFNTALSKSLAMRLTASVRQRDGYLDNLFGDDLNDEDKKNLRLALLWEPGEQTEALLRVAYEEQDQESGVLHTINSAAWEAANPGRNHDDFGKVAYDFEQVEERDLVSASLEINHDFRDMTFTSITGYRDFDTELIEDLDGSNNPEFFFGSSNPEESEFYSQEFRLTGANERVKWTLGGTYTYEEVEHKTEAFFLMTTFESFALKEGGIDPEDIPAIREANRNGEDPLSDLTGGLCLGINCDGLASAFFLDSLTDGAFGIVPLLLDLQPRIQAGYDDPWNEFVDSAGEYTSYAIYGDSTWTLSDKVNVSVGLRYTYDEKTFDLFTEYQNELVGVPFGIAFYNNGQPVLDSSQDEDWDAWSGRLVLDYQFNDEIMGYASVATGFKSGGFNSLNFGPEIDTSFDEEEVINYELGLKGRALEGSLQFSSAVFFYEYDNLQTLELIGQPVPSYNLRNADAEGYGFEIEGIWLIGEHWTLAGNYAYLDTEFTEYNIIEAAGETEEDDLTGEPRAESPKHKYNLSAQYTTPLAEVGQLTARLDYTWSDDRVDALRGPVEDYYELNGRIGLLSAANSWELAAWGTNLTDEEVLLSYGNGEAVGSTPAWRLLPRMWGVDLIFHF